MSRPAVYLAVPTTSEFDFVEEVPGRFICTICSNLLQRPHLTECCGQHYCKTCLTQWLGKSSHRGSCPQCRADRVTHIVNKSLEREIEELQVRCTNRGKGCTWVGEKGALSGHLKSDSGCKYEEVKCTLGKCAEVMERREHATHVEKDCVYRPYKCKYCGHKDFYIVFHLGIDVGPKSHFFWCPCYPVSCPNKCGSTDILRKDMASHMKECQLQEVQCPFAETGCVEMFILRRDLPSHLEKRVQWHMLCLLKSHTKLKRKYNELAKVCKCKQKT